MNIHALLTKSSRLLEGDRPGDYPGCLDALLAGAPLRRGLHEVFTSTPADAAAATGFALTLALGAASNRTILLVRQKFLDTETGHLNASGLCELGIDPSRLILVRARDAEDALRAGEQGAHCAVLGAVLIALWGESNLLNLTSSRRLSLASSKSNVPVFMLRVAASPAPSAAATRWTVQATTSNPFPADSPGSPAFLLNLIRHRGGTAGQQWFVEWDRDRKCFRTRQRFETATVPRPLVSISRYGPSAMRDTRYEILRTG